MSLTGKRWTDPALRAEGSPSDIVAAIAATRDLGHDERPWLDIATYPMAEVAAERVREAVRNAETVGIIGDYDCDGVTSTAILVRMLRRLDTEPVVRLPHRLKEGYGAQALHVEELAAKGVTLLITTDTGIVATEALALAKEKGMDAIVVDHHAFAELPPAYAILHPALTALEAHPSAAGVAFALAHAVLGPAWPDHDTDLALAAIGTIADVVPLTHGNRTMVREGLAALARVPAASALGMLRDRSGAGIRPTAMDIAFRMAPRLNAAGRLDDAAIGLRALLGDEASVDALEALNAERQRVTQACMEEAFATVDPANLPACVCVASENFPRGVVGLVAGKLAERFGRPALVASIGGGSCTASLRGVPGHDIALALRNNGGLFTAFGGHAMAGGCSFALADFDAVRDALCADVLSSVAEEDLRPVVAVEAAIDASAATLALADALAVLEPFGAENREPLFLLENVAFSGVRRIGSDLRHLSGKIGNTGVVAFGLGHLADTVPATADIVCRVTANEWNGTRRAQLSVVDIRVAQTGASFPSISKTAMTGTFKADAIL